MMPLQIYSRLSNWFKSLSMPQMVLALLFALLVIFAIWIYPRTSCALSGGEWIPVGLAQEPACIHTYPDAGKACLSSEECTGACVIYDPPSQGQPTPSVGVCKTTNNPFVCYAPIEHPEIYGCSD